MESDRSPGRALGVFWGTVVLFSAMAWWPAMGAWAWQATDSHRERAMVGVKAVASAPAPTPQAAVTKLRLGTHDGFARVVLELAGPQEWSIDQSPDAPIRIIIPGVGLDSGVRRMDFQKGLVRSIQPLRRSGGVEVFVVCEPAVVKVRTFTLADPDRLVMDVMRPDARDGGPTIPQGVTAPPAENDAPPARSPLPTAPGGETPRPSAVERSARTAAESAPPAKASSSGRATTEPPAADAEEGVTPLTVVLDPGHGGHDTGAIGPSGLMEKDVVLDLAFRLRRLLQDRLGVRVLMTRTDDVFVSLPDRTAFANRVKADFLVSLHVNAANKRGAIGFETFFFSREPSDNDARGSAQRENLVIDTNRAGGKDLESLLKTTLVDMAVTRDMKESSNLAERILSSLEKILRVDNRGVKSGPFYVLATAAMPAVLVESAFITNPREERKLQRDDYRQRIARALFEGIAAYKIRYEQRLGLRSAPAGVGS